MMNSKSKAAIVTGGGSGIGRATAILLSNHGYNVIVADLILSAALETADHCHNNQIDGNGNKGNIVVGRKVDVGKENEIEELCVECVNLFGGLDVMVANAGVGGKLKQFYDITKEDFENVFGVNVMGVFYCIKHATRQMMLLKGRDTNDDRMRSVIVTASVVGLRPGDVKTSSIHYNASKAAVMNMVQTCAVQSDGLGIRYNAVLPGITETGINKVYFEWARERGKQIGKGRNPLNRYASPEEVAKVISFLADEQASSYINGQAIAVDGGWTSSMTPLKVFGKF